MKHIQKVIVVFKSHFDIGFTMTAADVLKFYATQMLDAALDTLDQTTEWGNSRYVLTLPAWPLRIILERCAPDKRARLENYIRQGRVAWHALAFTSHTDFASARDIFWNLQESLKLCQRFGMPRKRAANMMDVPGHSRMLAAMLAAGGVDFLHLGCNQFATPPQVPTLFWWQAPSGQRVLTQYTKGGYGAGIVPPEDWQLPVWMVFANIHDNGMPHPPQEVQALLAKVRQAHPQAEITTGTLEDVREMYLACDTGCLPVVTQDLADTWIHIAGTYPQEVSLVRQLRGRIRRIESAMAGSATATWDALGLPLDMALENMALFAEHTWGLDVKTWLGPIPCYDKADFEVYRNTAKCKLMEQSWNEQRTRARQAEKACMACEALLGIGTADRPDTATPLLITPNSAESNLWRLAFDPQTGAVTSLYHKGLQAFILHGRQNVLQYRYDVYGSEDMTQYLRDYAYRFSDWGVNDNGRMEYPECAHHTAFPAFKGVRVQSASVTFEYSAGLSATQFGDAPEIAITVTLPDEGAVTIEIHLQGKRGTPYVESGALCLAFANAANPRWHINKAGEVLQPERDIANGANHAFYALERFAALETDAWVAAVETQDAPLLSIGENGVFTYRKQYQANEPEMRFCLFNTMWGTNCPQWIDGDMRFVFRLDAQEPAYAAQLYERCESAAAPFTLPEGVETIGIWKEGKNWALVLHHLRNVTRNVALHWPGYTLGIAQPNHAANKPAQHLKLTLMPFAYQVLVASPLQGE